MTLGSLKFVLNQYQIAIKVERKNESNENEREAKLHN
jgi:hypothetical protein